MKRVMEYRSYRLVYLFLLHCRESLMDYGCMKLSVPITPQLIPPVGCCSSRNLFARVDGCHYHFTIRCLQGHPVEKVFPPRPAVPSDTHHYCPNPRPAAPPVCPWLMWPPRRSHFAKPLAVSRKWQRFRKLLYVSILGFSGASAVKWG